MKRILAGVVAFLLLISMPVIAIVSLLLLAGLYWAFVLMTHNLIHNNWIAIPIDLCMLGVIYSVMKVSRYHLGNKLNESGGAGINPEELDDNDDSRE